MAQRRPEAAYDTLSSPTAAARASESWAVDDTGTHLDTDDMDDPLPKSTTTATYTSLPTESADAIAIFSGMRAPGPAGASTAAAAPRRRAHVSTRPLSATRPTPRSDWSR
jgi:hypothetical protein